MKKQFILLALISLFIKVESMENLKDYNRFTYIMEQILTLEEAKADSTHRNWQTPLVYTCACSTEIFATFLPYFIKKGVDIKLNESTLLTETCRAGNIVNLKILLNLGLNPNSESVLHEIPIICAIKGGHVEIVHLLLEFKANPNFADREGFTPLMHIFHIADSEDASEDDNKVFDAEKAKSFASALIKAGAKIDTKCQGKTVFDLIAGQPGMEDLAEYIKNCAVEFKATSSEKKCNSCNFKLAELLRCSNCKKVYYCNRKCQLADWKSHKSVCKKE